MVGYLEGKVNDRQPNMRWHCSERLESRSDGHSLVSGELPRRFTPEVWVAILVPAVQHALSAPMAAPPGPINVLRGHQGDVQCLEHLSPNLLAAGCVLSRQGGTMQGPARGHRAT